MAELFTLKPGDLIQLEWSGEVRAVVCDRITEEGAVIRDLSAEEIAAIEKSELADEDARWKEYWASR